MNNWSSVITYVENDEVLKELENEFIIASRMASGYSPDGYDVRVQVISRHSYEKTLQKIRAIKMGITQKED